MCRTRMTEPKPPRRAHSLPLKDQRPLRGMWLLVFASRMAVANVTPGPARGPFRGLVEGSLHPSCNTLQLACDATAGCCDSTSPELGLNRYEAVRCRPAPAAGWHSLHRPEMAKWVKSGSNA